MTYPVEKLILLFKAKNSNYTRTQVNEVVDNYRYVSQSINEGNQNKEDNAQKLFEFINEFLTPLGFAVQESIGILEQLDVIYRTNSVGIDTELNELLAEEEEEPESSLNVLGKFMMYDDDGAKKHYSKNDVVYYEGKTYVATDDVSGWVPESLHPDNKWKPVDLPDNTIDGEEF